MQDIRFAIRPGTKHLQSPQMRGPGGHRGLSKGQHFVFTATSPDPSFLEAQIFLFRGPSTGYRSPACNETQIQEFLQWQSFGHSQKYGNDKKLSR